MVLGFRWLVRDTGKAARCSHTAPTSGDLIMPAIALTLFEREQIRVGIEHEETDSVIAARVGRHRCTINAEINRNGGRVKYSAVKADRRAARLRRRPRAPKLVSDQALGDHVVARLRARDSPMTISVELARGVWGLVRSISHESIYRAVYSEVLPVDCRTGLHLQRRRRKRRGQRPRGGHSLGDFVSIHDRPKIASERGQVGHLEGDLIVGAYNRTALITIFDRASRYLWLERVASKSAADTYTSLLRMLNRIPVELRHTLTWDQGAEIAKHQQLAQRRQIAIYIADPKAPWQRPTNENGNAMVRRYVGKGTDLSRFTTQQLRAIETRINTTPRRSLGWDTAHDIYTQAVTMTS